MDDIKVLTPDSQSIFKLLTDLIEKIAGSWGWGEVIYLISHHDLLHLINDKS